VWVKNIYTFEEIWNSFKKEFRKHIWNEKVDVFSSVYHFQRNYLLEEEKEIEKYEFLGDAKPVDYDELDIKILKALAKNARMPLIDLAEKVKTPERTVAFRLKRMEKKKIIPKLQS